MSAINFTGLASGLDTDALIKGLMEVERQPLNRLEKEKEYQQTRLDAFKEFNEKLSALNTAVDGLYLNSKVRESSISLSSEEYVSASVTSARPGTYAVAVERLAQVQKSATAMAYASQADPVFGAGELELTVGDGVIGEGAAGAVYTLSIDSENNSLSGIMGAINKGTDQHGISASIIDNGNEGAGRYYLMLSGADSSTEFTLTSNLSGGTQPFSMASPTQNAQDAVAYLDGIRITSTTNTFQNTLNGVSFTLEAVSPDNGAGGLATTTMKIGTDTDAVVEKMEAFVTAYNEAVSFVTSQSKGLGSGVGTLVGDSGLNAIKRRLQNMLTTSVEGNTSFKTLSQLGLATNRDGTLTFESSVLTKAIGDDFEEVVRLMAGDDNVGGIFKEYKSFLNNMTHSSNGLYANRKENIARVMGRIDDDILRMESRLDKRELMLMAQFTALEKMISLFNAQSDYLTQQMDRMPSYGDRD